MGRFEVLLVDALGFSKVLTRLLRIALLQISGPHIHIKIPHNTILMLLLEQPPHNLQCLIKNLPRLFIPIHGPMQQAHIIVRFSHSRMHISKGFLLDLNGLIVVL